MSELLMPLSNELVVLNQNKYRMKATIDAIQLAYQDQESGIVIGQCKSLIESFSKSVLDEFKVEYASDAVVGRLTKKAVQALGVGEDTEKPRKTREAYLKLITSFSNNIESAAKGIGELRNDFCPLAHGRSVYQNKLDMSYAVFIANQTDSLVWFMHELRIRALAPRDKVIEKDNYYNEQLDDTYEAVDILGDTYLPSEILWSVNPEKYYDSLMDHRQEQEQEQPID
ncbi:abortive infection family protein [Vibrio splendidus]|uniref:Abortive infection family protein n=1 Tax=Vibrio splendidus TaxID=29497 RepID=A0ABV4LRF5_VIBSP